MATAYAVASDVPALDENTDYRCVRFTADEFLELAALGAFENRRVELVDGELWEEDLHGWTHAKLQMRVGVLLSSAIDPLAVVLVGDLSVKISERTVRDFDVGLTVPDLGDARAVEPAQVVLAVEVAVTTLQTDLYVKAREYGRVGIPTYWVVDAKSKIVHAMTVPGPDGYADHRRIAFDEPLAVPGGGTIVIAPSS